MSLSVMFLIRRKRWKIRTLLFPCNRTAQRGLLCLLQFLRLPSPALRLQLPRQVDHLYPEASLLFCKKTLS